MHYCGTNEFGPYVIVIDLKPGEKVLDWPTRKKIAFGTAHGLEYLHEYCNPKIIHRDLKAANILLNDEYEPFLGDFGLAKLVDTELTHITTQVRGTMGHIAPEYLSTGKSSEKTDVFGYGITLLELVTGQRAIDFSRLEDEEDVLLLDHVSNNIFCICPYFTMHQLVFFDGKLTVLISMLSEDQEIAERKKTGRHCG